MWHEGLLTDSQTRLVSQTLDEPVLVRNLSWGLIDTVVLQVRASGQLYVIKAGGPTNHHMDRELTAFSSFTTRLSERGVAARAVNMDREAKLLILEYLYGSLVEGHPAEFDPDTHEQAGAILRTFHSQAQQSDPDTEMQMKNRTVRWLDSKHRIDPELERASRKILAEYRPQTINSVPTHGDWQPRNWLIHDGHVRVIDFGRFAWRAPETDFARLAAQQWRSVPELEAAFFRSYGPDPRQDAPERWHIIRLAEAIGTAVWAYQVGAEEFEAQGHRMLSGVLSELP